MVRPVEVRILHGDLNILIGFAVQLLMYATPIVYPISFLKEKGYEWAMNINPLAPLVEAFRFCLFGKGTFTVEGLLYSTSFTAVILFLGLVLFNRVEKTFMDTV